MPYFKNKIWSTSVLFLQETHSDSHVEQKWKKDIKGPVFFLSQKGKFLWHFIAYFGIGTFIVKKQETDKEGRILILDASINDSKYIYKYINKYK